MLLAGTGIPITFFFINYSSYFCIYDAANEVLQSLGTFSAGGAPFHPYLLEKVLHRH